jgi:hypothetical protein
VPSTADVSNSLSCAKRARFAASCSAESFKKSLLSSSVACSSSITAMPTRPTIAIRLTSQYLWCLPLGPETPG